MAEYDQKAPTIRYADAPSAGVVAQRAVPASPNTRLDGLRDALNQGPRVTQLAALAASLQRTPETIATAARDAPVLMPRHVENAVQRVDATDDEELPGDRETTQRKGLNEDHVVVAQRVEAPAAQPNRTGMPDGLKTGIEARSGLSMDDVRVHRNSSKPAQLQALAFAQGTDIHLGPGQERHLPHEAWHVVQQKQGRVRPTLQMKTGVPINDDHGLEQEADSMGSLAARGGDVPAQMIARPTTGRPGPGTPGIVQAYHEDRSEDGSATLRSQALNPRVDDAGPSPKTIFDIQRTPSGNAPFLVSDDESMAVHATSEEPKEFFAVDEVLQDANASLQKNKSPVRLRKTRGASGGTVRFKSQTLDAIEPTRADESDEEFADLWADICINVANHIMGNAGKWSGDAIFRSGATEARAPLNTIYGDSGPSSVNNLAAHLSTSTRSKDDAPTAINSAMNAMTDHRTRPPAGEVYGERSGRLGRSAANIGVNEFARPDTGEGFATFSISSGKPVAVDYASGKPIERAFSWGYHYAAVVAKSIDGDDMMTLENYNRSMDVIDTVLVFFRRKYHHFVSQFEQDRAGQPTADVQKELDDYLKTEHATAKVEFSRIMNTQGNTNTRAWFFRMYGPQPGQSFHEKQTESGFFANPLTLHVRRATLASVIDPITRREAEILGSLTPDRIKFASARSAVDQLVDVTRQYFGRMRSIIGQDAGPGGWRRVNDLYQEWLARYFVPRMGEAIRATASSLSFPKSLPALKAEARKPPTTNFLSRTGNSIAAMWGRTGYADDRSASLNAIHEAILSVPDGPMAEDATRSNTKNETGESSTSGSDHTKGTSHADEETENHDTHDEDALEANLRGREFKRLLAALPRADRAALTTQELKENYDNVNSEFASTTGSSSSTHSAPSRLPISRDAFDLTSNPGGGDCLYHALAGRTLDLKEILAVRREIANVRRGMPTSDPIEAANASAVHLTLQQTYGLEEGRELTDRLDAVPNAVYAAMQEVPEMFAGDDELVQYCSLHDVSVGLVLSNGELRRADRNGVPSITFPADGQKQAIRDLWDGVDIALYKTPNHYERITGVRDRDRGS